MKNVVILIGIISCRLTSAQIGNVGINTTSPNFSTILDVIFTNNELSPRVTLISTDT
jgi:hypothetical protein